MTCTLPSAHFDLGRSLTDREEQGPRVEASIRA